MTEHLAIAEIKEQINKTGADFITYCTALSDVQFFYQPADKWSIAQQVKHLITATKAAGLAFTLPKVIVRWVGGKPNRSSGTYNELVAKYKKKLEEGGKASGPYIPKPVPETYGKEKLLNRFSEEMSKMSQKLGVWEEAQLDLYIVPHPLLGKITIRELCYFTIYHTYHHLNNIRQGMIG